jgi:hypothetical protein
MVLVVVKALIEAWLRRRRRRHRRDINGVSRRRRATKSGRRRKTGGRAWKGVHDEWRRWLAGLPHKERRFRLRGENIAMKPSGLEGVLFVCIHCLLAAIGALQRRLALFKWRLGRAWRVWLVYLDNNNGRVMWRSAAQATASSLLAIISSA